MLNILSTIQKIWLCVPLIAGGTLQARSTKINELPNDTRIVLQRGACEHRCAVYKVTISGDGSVIFDGQYYVRKAGQIKSHISEALVRQILDKAEALRFFDLKNRYGFHDDEAGCDSILSDAPSATISIRSGGKTKTILHHHRCVGAESAQLGEFEDTIDKAANTLRWIK